MLSLQLRSGEYLTIGDDVVIQIFEQSGSTFQVAVKAPKEVPILRGEVHERNGERPSGLLLKRPKSPSERARNAQNMERLAAKKEFYAMEDKRKEEERISFLKELSDIASRMDNLAADQENNSLHQELSNLRSRLAQAAEEK